MHFISESSNERFLPLKQPMSVQAPFPFMQLHQLHSFFQRDPSVQSSDGFSLKEGTDGLFDSGSI